MVKKARQEADSVSKSWLCHLSLFPGKFSRQPGPPTWLPGGALHHFQSVLADLAVAGTNTRQIAALLL